MEIIIKNLEEMERFAYKFASSLKGNELIALKGNLGAGKTTFTKYVGKALGVKEDIISPTFNIIKIYTCKLGNFYHVDAYRLEGLFYDPILDDYIFDDNALKFIEWYNFLDQSIFDDAIKIDIEVLPNFERKITITGGNLCLN